MRRKVFATNIAWSVLTHIFGRGSLVIASIIMAQSLNRTDFSTYSYFQLTVSMLGVYSAMGLGITASSFFSEWKQTNHLTRPPIGVLWAISISLGLLFSIIIYFIPSNLLGSSLNISSWIIAVGVLSIILGIIPINGALGLECYAETTAISLISGITLITGSIIASKSNSLHTAIYFYIASNLVQAIGNTYLIDKNIGLLKICKNTRFNINEFSKIKSFVGPMIGVSLISGTGSWLVGRIILSGPDGINQFALYAIGLQLLSLALFFPGVVSRVLLPQMIKAKFISSNSKTQQQKTLTKTGIKLTVLSSLLVSVTGILFSPILSKLYGESVNISPWIISAFMISAIPAAPANTIGNTLIATNNQNKWLFLILSWFIFLILIELSIVNFGAISGAITHFIASLTLTILGFSTLKKLHII